MPSLYANIVSSNAVIQPNNNTSLYNPLGGNAIPVNGNINANNVNVSNNVHVGGQISATGNITTSGYFIGDGSQLSNIASSYGNANVAAFLPTYTGNLSGAGLGLTGAAVVTGNITTGGFYFGDGSQLTGITTDYSNANVAAFLPTYSGNISAGNIAVVNSITGANITASGQISATGDISTQGNLRTLGAQGNIVGPNYVSANFFVGDGSLLTNVTSTGNYSNSNVTSLLAAFGSNTISTTGNITSGYLFGNGSQLTGIAASYGNANVATFLANFGSNTIVTNGNITGGNIIGNGQSLTNLPGANVTGTVANATFATTAGSATTATDAAQANYANIANSVSGANVTGSVAQANVANTANSVAGGNVSGQVANALVAGTVYTAAQPNITSVGTLTVVNTTGNVSATGNITGGNLAIGNNTNIGGNLSVVGTIFGTFAGNISGNLVVPGSNTDVLFNNQGNAGASTNFRFDSATNTMLLNGTANVGSLNSTGNVSGSNIIGNGSGLTNLTGANVVGAVANATQADTANVANSVAGGNVTGQVANALVAGTVYTNAQPNITSVGTLTSLSVSGNVVGGNLNTAGNVSGSYILGDGSQLTNLPVQPGTYGNANVATFLANFGSNTVVTTGNISGGNLTATGVVYTSQIESNTSLDLNSPSEINANGNLRVGDNNTNTQIATHGAADLLITTHAGDANQGNIRLYNGASGNIDVTTNGTGKINLNGAVFTNDGITATGNIQGANINGNGSGLSSITGANVTGSVAQATVANTANAVAGGNVSGQVANALVAGTVYTAAQPAITSVGTLSSLNVSANAAGAFAASVYNINPTGAGLDVRSGDGSGTNTMFVVRDTNLGNTRLIIQEKGATTVTNDTISLVGNVIASGPISAVGNITGNYIFGNGSQLTGLPATYGNANVTTLLADFGSNTISTTGNVTIGNLNLTGNIVDTGAISIITGSDGNIALAPNGTGIVTASSAISATGNVTGSFFVGNGSALTGITTSAGGSNTQLQFNNGGAFAGNVAMTFDSTTGNVTLGNVVINANVITNLNSFQSNTNPNPGRVLFGNGIAGNYNPTINTTSSRILQVDQIFKYDDGLRSAGITSTMFGNLSQGNIGTANSNSRLQAAQSELYVVNGNAVGTNAFAIRGGAAGLFLGSAANVGNAFVQAGTAFTSFVTVNAGSTANTTVNLIAGSMLNGPVANAIGVMSYMQGSANITGNAYGFYMPGPSSTLAGQSQGNIARNAPNYYFLRNDDTLAKSRLGSLELYQNFTANASTTGSVTIDKNSGQYQNMYLTGNVTSMAFSNFVTRVQTPSGTFNNQSDVVTLVIQQGATPYTVTMPTGNTQIRYANGNSTVPSVANSTVVMTVTGTYNYNLTSNQYLINIDPVYT
jgi:hypothetical protein